MQPVKGTKPQIGISCSVAARAAAGGGGPQLVIAPCLHQPSGPADVWAWPAAKRYLLFDQITYILHQIINLL